MGGQNEETRQGNPSGHSRDIASRGGLIGVEVFDVDHNLGAVGSPGGGPDVGLISCEERGGSLSQSFGNLFGGEDRTARWNGGPMRSGVGVDGNAHDNSGERKKSGERDGEAKEHGGVGGG